MASAAIAKKAEQLFQRGMQNALAGLFSEHPDLGLHTVTLAWAQDGAPRGEAEATTDTFLGCCLKRGLGYAALAAYISAPDCEKKTDALIAALRGPHARGVGSVLCAKTSPEVLGDVLLYENISEDVRLMMLDMGAKISGDPQHMAGVAVNSFGLGVSSNAPLMCALAVGNGAEVPHLSAEQVEALCYQEASVDIRFAALKYATSKLTYEAPRDLEGIMRRHGFNDTQVADVTTALLTYRVMSAPEKAAPKTERVARASI